MSQAWHRFLRLDQDVEPTTSEEFTTNPEQERWQLLRTSDIHQQLQLLFSAISRFRGIQEQALQAICFGRSPILVVSGTGSGKSLLFLLPASYAFSGTTVVITPLVAL